MKTNIHSFPSRVCGSFAALILLAVAGVAPAESADAPMRLDVARFHTESLVAAGKTNKVFAGFLGVQMVDGVPLEVVGHGWLYGQKEANWVSKTEEDYPNFKGVLVGRKFDELHLLHGSRWQFVEGEAIALVRLNYTDGVAVELPICYGVHVRDWQRLRSEDKETLTDPGSKIVWRGDGLTSYKSTTRVFKSTLANPLPDRIVSTIDFISTRSLACYDLVAATVANKDSTRPVTPHVPSPEPERIFDGRCTVTVMDADSGKLLSGVLVDPGMNVDSTGVIATPLRTDSEGKAVIRYPKGRVTTHSVRVEMEGYVMDGKGGQGEFPEQMTVRLRLAGKVQKLARNLDQPAPVVRPPAPALLAAGTLAPDFEFTRIDNERKGRLSDLRGKIVILEFWATWCSPCQEPMAKMQKYAEQNPKWKDRVEVLALSIDDTMGTVRSHLTSRGWTNTFNVWAGSDAWQSVAPQAYKVSGVPTCYVINADGKVVQAGHPEAIHPSQIVNDLLK